MIKTIILTTAKATLNIIYIPIKCFKIQDKVVFLSRQFDYPNLDFTLLSEEILRLSPKTEVVFLCKKLRTGLLNKISYIGYIFVAMYHLATSKKAIVDTYIIPVSVLNHKKELEILQIWHALGAIKKFGHQTIDKFSGNKSDIAKAMNMHQNYDYVTAIGNRTADFFAEGFNIEKSKVKLIGMPRIDYILKEDLEKDASIYEKYPRLKEKKNILYVPTFRKEQINFMNEIYEKFDFENYNLVIKYHPLDKSRRNKENPINKKAVTITDKEINIFDLYKLCDIIITDYSSASLEACVLDKPIYFYVYDIDEYKEDPGLYIDLFEEMPNCTSREFDQIMNWIKQDEYDIDWVREYKNTYFHIDLSQNCTKALAEFILEGKEQNIPVTAQTAQGVQD